MNEKITINVESKIIKSFLKVCSRISDLIFVSIIDKRVVLGSISEDLRLCSRFEFLIRDDNIKELQWLSFSLPEVSISTKEKYIPITLDMKNNTISFLQHELKLEDPDDIEHPNLILRKQLPYTFGFSCTVGLRKYPLKLLHSITKIFGDLFFFKVNKESRSFRVFIRNRNDELIFNHDPESMLWDSPITNFETYDYLVSDFQKVSEISLLFSGRLYLSKSKRPLIFESDSDLINIGWAIAPAD